MKKNIQLVKLFALASSFTFSGGLAMIPMLQETLVEKHDYLSRESFYHYVALAQSVPGVMVVTTACLLGEKVNGRSGRLFAGLGAILPVLVIMSVLTLLTQYIPQTGIIYAMLSAIRVTAGVFILEAAIDMAPYILKKEHAKYFVIAVVIASLVFKVATVVIILAFCLIALISEVVNND